VISWFSQTSFYKSWLTTLVVLQHRYVATAHQWWFRQLINVLAAHHWWFWQLIKVLAAHHLFVASNNFVKFRVQSWLSSFFSVLRDVSNDCLLFHAQAFVNIASGGMVSVTVGVGKLESSTSAKMACVSLVNNSVDVLRCAPNRRVFVWEELYERGGPLWVNCKAGPGKVTELPSHQ